MRVTTEQMPQPYDKLIWATVLLLLIAGLFVNYTYPAIAWEIRLIAWIVFCAVELGLLSLTAAGKQALLFMKSAAGELRKVFWPTRQETLQTTLLVMAVVFIAGFFLWGIDTLFLWLIGLLTGQRG